jgi:hypothetical protein
MPSLFVPIVPSIPTLEDHPDLAPRPLNYSSTLSPADSAVVWLLDPYHRSGEIRDQTESKAPVTADSDFPSRALSSGPDALYDHLDWDRDDMIRVKERQIASRAVLLLLLRDDYLGEMMMLVMRSEGQLDLIYRPAYSARTILGLDAQVLDLMAYCRSCFSSLMLMERIMASLVLA